MNNTIFKTWELIVIKYLTKNINYLNVECLFTLEHIGTCHIVCELFKGKLNKIFLLIA